MCNVVKQSCQELKGLIFVCVSCLLNIFANCFPRVAMELLLKVL
jgi:hypothetical protein